MGLTSSEIMTGALVLCAALLLVLALRFGLKTLGEMRTPSAKSLIRFDYNLRDPCFVSDENGQIIHRNKAARAFHVRESKSQTVQDLLSHIIADPRTILFRLQDQLKTDKWASVDFATRTTKVKINARLIEDRSVYWRVSESKLKPGAQAATQQGHTLSIGRNGTVLSISGNLQELLGQKPKNVRDFLEWPVPKSSGTCRLRTKDGIKNHFCLYRDIALGRSEMTFFELPDEQQLGDDLFDALPIPMLQLDDTGVILGTNTQGLGFIKDDALIGKRFHEVFNGVGRTMVGWVSEVLEGMEEGATQFAELNTDGKEKFVQVTLCRVNKSGRTRFLAVLNDATELKSLEAQFVQSQKMQAIGQLAGGVAHDFNNLLTAISGHCDLLLLRHGESDPDFADLDQVRQNANRAAALVSQLLAFSRKQTLQPQTIDLEQTLADHTHLLNRLVGETTVLSLSHGSNLKRISADKRQFEQVIMNLVVNARDAMGGKGQIRIETTMRSYEQPTTRDRATIPAGDYCVVTVSDQGCGIESEKLQRVFEPFYTSKKTGEGTGLGLSTVYGIVKQSGGFVFIDSVVGVGTSFEVMFPAVTVQADPEPAPQEITQPIPSDEPADGVVLLVEDEAPVRAFASRALKLKGFSVLEASCAEDALEMLSDDSLEVDIFVTDVVMPGVDGPTWVGEALKKRPNAKVVFVSGYAENRCDDLHIDIPNSIFLPKPFSLNQLTSTVARLH